MILIITHKEDYTADFVIDKLNEYAIPYYRFNCEDYLKSNVSIRFGIVDNYSIGEYSRFTAVWYRRTKLPNIKCQNEGERIYLMNEMDAFVNNLFGIIKAKWLSNPISVANAENKFLQLSLAKSIGFNIPNTLATTDISELRSFIKNNKKTVIKPVSRGRIDYPNNSSKLIFTNIMSEEIIIALDAFELTPAIYQEYVDKDYELRVTVVGEDIFAASVDSQSIAASSVDWRRKRTKFEEYNLPEDIKEKCLLLLRKLNISYGAFDIIKAKNGLYYFLEVNPNGQWVWIEKDTKQLISESIIKFLSC